MHLFNVVVSVIVVFLCCESANVLSAVIPNSTPSEEEATSGTICFDLSCSGGLHKTVKKDSTMIPSGFSSFVDATSEEVRNSLEGYADEWIAYLSPKNYWDSSSDKSGDNYQSPRQSRMANNDTVKEEQHGNKDMKYAAKPRTQRVNRKIWMAVLAGIILKFVSMVPLILGKLTLLGTAAILTSKLSLLIVAVMVMKNVFSTDKDHGQKDTGFASQQHQAYQHGMSTDYSPGAHGVGYPSYMGAVPHRRWAYRTTGRQLGGGVATVEEKAY